MKMENVRLEGKTAIVTGANTGIGKETALDLAKRGARVILACRSEARANEAAAEIRIKSGNENVFVSLVDLSSMKSVTQFTERFLKSEENLHLLINNAGMMCDKQTTSEGMDLAFASNHFGHFLLTVNLLDMLKRSRPSRIINLSSDSHRQGRIDLEDLDLEKEDRGMFTIYAVTKLANVLFTRELHKRLEGTGVTTYALHPGWVKTEIARNTNIFLKFLTKCVSFLQSSAEQGCRTTLYCALQPGLEQYSGLYFSNCAVKTPASAALDDEMAKCLWEASEQRIQKTLSKIILHSV